MACPAVERVDNSRAKSEPHFHPFDPACAFLHGRIQWRCMRENMVVAHLKTSTLFVHTQIQVYSQRDPIKAHASFCGLAAYRSISNTDGQSTWTRTMRTFLVHRLCLMTDRQLQLWVLYPPAGTRIEDRSVLEVPKSKRAEPTERCKEAHSGVGLLTLKRLSECDDPITAGRQLEILTRL